MNHINYMDFYQDMYGVDFPEFGKQCQLKEPWRGYRSGTIVATTQRGFIVQLSSGAELELYEDEIEFD